MSDLKHSHLLSLAGLTSLGEQLAAEAYNCALTNMEDATKGHVGSGLSSAHEFERALAALAKLPQAALRDSLALRLCSRALDLKLRVHVACFCGEGAILPLDGADRVFLLRQQLPLAHIPKGARFGADPYRDPAVAWARMSSALMSAPFPELPAELAQKISEGARRLASAGTDWISPHLNLSGPRGQELPPIQDRIQLIFNELGAQAEAAAIEPSLAPGSPRSRPSGL